MPPGVGNYKILPYLPHL